MENPQANAVIEQLRRSNRRWKTIAIGSSGVLAALVIGIGGASALQWNRAAAERDLAMQMALQAEAAKQAEHDARR